MKNIIDGKHKTRIYKNISIWYTVLFDIWNSNMRYNHKSWIVVYKYKDLTLIFISNNIQLN